MTKAAEYNLCLEQGASMLPIIFVFRHVIVLSEDAGSPSGQAYTTINVFPIPHPLSSGATLTFGTVTLTLSASASEGAETLAVNSSSTYIAAGTTAKGDLVDFTGHTPKAQYRTSYDATEAIDFDTAIAGTGKISVSLSHTKSEQLQANITPFNAADIPDLQNLNSEDLRRLLPGQSPGVWDLETEDSSDPVIVRRWYYGRVLVTAGVTANV